MVTVEDFIDVGNILGKIWFSLSDTQIKNEVNEVTVFCYFSHRGWQIGNRKQCLKFHWISKQLKNSKATSEAVLYENCVKKGMVISFI